MGQPMNFAVRSCIDADLDEITHIELRSSDYPLEYDDFEMCIKKYSHIGLVALIDDVVYGYLLYNRKKTSYELVSMAVHPQFRRQGAGSALLKSFINRTIGRYPIKVVVSDQNFPFHCLMKQNGFKATKVISNHFGPFHDGYEFVYEAKIKRART